jgi:hypothetical protein
LMARVSAFSEFCTEPAAGQNDLGTHFKTRIQFG